MADSSKKLIAGLSIRTDGTPDLEKLKDAIADTGEAGQKAAPKITNAFESAEKAVGTFEKKLTSGKAITQRDVDAIVRQFVILEQETEEAFGSAANAPKALQDALERTEASVKKANHTFGQMDDALKDNRANVQAAGDSFPGLGNALESLGGPVGNITSKFGLYGAALAAGLSLGKQVAAAIGTDFQSFEAAAEGLKKSAATITAAFTTDGFGAAILQTVAVVRTLGDTVANSGKQLEGFNALVQAGVERNEALRLSAEGLAAAAETHSLAVAGGTESLKAWNRIVNETDPAELGGKLQQLKGWFKDLAEAEGEAAGKIGELQKAKDEYIKKIDDTIAAMIRERVARREGLDVMTEEMDRIQRAMQDAETANKLKQAATEVQRGVTQALLDEVGVIEQLTNARDVATGQLDVYAQGLRRTVDEYKDGLTPAQEATYGELIKLADSYDTLDDAGKRRLQSLIDEVQSWAGATIAVDQATKSAKNYSDASRTVVAEAGPKGWAIKEVGTAAETSSVSVDKATRTITNLGTALKTAGGQVVDYDKILDNLTARFDTAATAARNLTSAIEEQIAAAKKAVEAEAAAPPQTVPIRETNRGSSPSPGINTSANTFGPK